LERRSARFGETSRKIWSDPGARFQATHCKVWGDLKRLLINVRLYFSKACATALIPVQKQQIVLDVDQQTTQKQIVTVVF
jgi:hypothetical protein